MPCPARALCRRCGRCAGIKNFISYVYQVIFGILTILS
jgi:hypothetical protein